ncbi:LytR cell envelope-related transcriptional attenuator [Actinopolyspora mzabensis]|uniref:LytR cell envelope-related transcriptional attenuator n=1 Tax=Actinopolyspora mzabensis TaxID=995066 RepID=A0A1G9C6Q9_ACTMZ|nr:LytR C-terminal domain-containing protein [Actinopolyspora mzabensis]SDK47341.1 LytR cell envelope-related transcriptional attenuator [Actinopolyspora mzabensis]
MPSGEFATGRSAARIGGFTLLGVGVLALFFGVATALTGDGEPSAEPTGTAPPPPASTSSGPTSSAGKPPGTSEPNTSASSEPSESSSSRPSESAADRGSSATSESSSDNRNSDDGKAGDGDAGEGSSSEGDSRQRISLRVYNNSKIENLAHRAARDLRGAGFRVVEVDNYAGGRIPVTTVYYRPDTEERAQARTVARRLDARLKPRFNGITDASPGVIVIVTKNYDGIG